MFDLDLRITVKLSQQIRVIRVCQTPLLTPYRIYTSTIARPTVGCRIPICADPVVQAVRIRVFTVTKLFSIKYHSLRFLVTVTPKPTFITTPIPWCRTCERTGAGRRSILYLQHVSNIFQCIHHCQFILSSQVSIRFPIRLTQMEVDDIEKEEDDQSPLHGLDGSNCLLSFLCVERTGEY